MPRTPRSPLRRSPDPRPLLCGLLLLLAAAAGEARACDLKALGEAYRLGRFASGAREMEACLQAGLPEAELSPAYALLAKLYLGGDEVEKADDAIARLLAADPAFTPAFDDPPLFARRVEGAKRSGAATYVSSVSKTREKLAEAPATVVVLTAEEIARRGYLDLEEVLHDLPGFDVVRGRGDLYSLFYQRGYRAQNDRTLFLVDGIEENDLWCDAAYISRQYPLSNVDRIEVVYGPASTLYGANAFVGVINVLTKDPEQILGEGRRFAVRSAAGAGSWRTSYGDATVAGRHREKNVSYSLTARVFHSDGMDLESFADWDYDPAFYAGLTLPYRRQLAVAGGAAAAAFLAGLAPAERARLLASPYFRVDVSGIALTDAGLERARSLDQEGLAATVEGRPVRFTDPADDWLVSGKLRVSNLTLGFETWRRAEGFNGWYTDQFYAGAKNGVVWDPIQSFLYLKYNVDLGRQLHLAASASFRRHTLGRDTREEQLIDYARGQLGIVDLLAGTPAYWRRTAYDLQSNQFRSETTLAYSPSPRWSTVGGVELRNSLVQGDFGLVVSSPRPADALDAPQAEFFDSLDLGAYVQTSYHVSERVKLVAGARVDHNSVRQGGGYGAVWNPRLGVIRSAGGFVWKAIYAEAFKEPSNFNRYSIAPGLRDLPNPDLGPEKVRNLELDGGWQRGEELSVDAALYRALYSNAVVTRVVGASFQNQDLGRLEIVGLESRLHWQAGGFELDANYTYTDPENTDPRDASGQRLTDARGRPLGRLRLGAIARHHANLALGARLAPRLSASLRLNYVGERRTGPDGDFADPADRVPAYGIANLALTWDLGRGAKLQLLVNNLLDRRYSDPGVYPADGIKYALLLPQDRRSLFGRLAYGF